MSKARPIAFNVRTGAIETLPGYSHLYLTLYASSDLGYEPDSWLYWDEMLTLSAQSSPIAGHPEENLPPPESWRDRRSLTPGFDLGVTDDSHLERLAWYAWKIEEIDTGMAGGLEHQVEVLKWFTALKRRVDRKINDKNLTRVFWDKPSQWVAALCLLGAIPLTWRSNLGMREFEPHEIPYQLQRIINRDY